MKSFSELKIFFDEALRNGHFEGNPPELYEPVAYTMAMGGKRMRPLLLLMSCEMFDGNLNEAISPAIGIEIFHNFTLIHDDIMDQAPLRRGNKTVHEKWDRNVAILSGDTMFALAYKHMVSVPGIHLPEVLKTFTQTAIEVCEGQQYDMNFEKAPEVSIADYLEMIRLKTAVLLGCAMKTGAIVAGASLPDQQRICDFASNLGIAFQLKDDLLDAFGDEQKFGKKTGGDIKANKKTYLYLKSLELSDAETRKRLIHTFTHKEKDAGKKVRQVRQIFRELGIPEETEKLMREYYQKARQSLDKVGVSGERKKTAEAFSELLMEREH